jgi:hypothetical protein
VSITLPRGSSPAQAPGSLVIAATVGDGVGVLAVGVGAGELDVTVGVGGSTVTYVVGPTFVVPLHATSVISAQATPTAPLVRAPVRAAIMK